MRKLYRMTTAQRDKLLEAMRPVPAMWIGGPPRSVQQNANDAWMALGREMGFDGMSVQPAGGELEFTAEALSAAPKEPTHSDGVGTPDGSQDANDPMRGWHPMETAPKDGTIVRLLVDYTGEDACHPLEDARLTHTIGGCTDDHTGLSEGWKFAGWSWEQDCFCEGRGKPIGWLPFAHLDLTPGVKGPEHG